MTAKEYVYRVSDASGNYIGVWTDVVSDLTWSQQINTPGTTTTVRLARSANNRIEKRDNLVTNAGVNYITNNGDQYTTVSSTSNTIGTGTDVDLNYQVDVYVHYGYFDTLVKNNGDPYVTDTGDPYIVAKGSPLGRRVFSGIIIDYEANYGDQEYVDVTVASHGFELSKAIHKSGSTTTVSYSSTAPETIVKAVLDTNPGVMSYSAGSIQTTGITINHVSQLNTKLENIQNVYNQTDNGWFWYGNPADNLVYMQLKNTQADHTFYMRQHINTIKIKRSMENLKNDVYFVGGDTSGGAATPVYLYKEYTDATNIAAWGRSAERITDRRYIIAASAQRYANKVMARYAAPVYTTQLTIPSEVYDIETISLGQVVAFANVGNFVDTLLFQIVQIDKAPHLITLQLGDLLDRIQDVVADTAADLQNTQYGDIPTAPS